MGDPVLCGSRPSSLGKTSVGESHKTGESILQYHIYIYIYNTCVCVFIYKRYHATSFGVEKLIKIVDIEARDGHGYFRSLLTTRPIVFHLSTQGSISAVLCNGQISSRGLQVSLSGFVGAWVFCMIWGCMLR